MWFGSLELTCGKNVEEFGDVTRKTPEEALEALTK